jgi:hypothetical protein
MKNKFPHKFKVGDLMLCTDERCHLIFGGCTLTKIPKKITSIREDGLALRFNNSELGCRYDHFKKA